MGVFSLITALSKCVLIKSLIPYFIILKSNLFNMTPRTRKYMKRRKYRRAIRRANASFLEVHKSFENLKRFVRAFNQLQPHNV